MAIRVTSLLMVSPVSLPKPATYNLKPRETKTFPYIEYDKFVNDPRIRDYLNKNVIRIDNLDEGEVGEYVSEWNQEPKLRLGTWTFWIDSTGSLRMVNGDPTGEFDGAIVGPGSGGVVPAHGHTHVFTATDPIPRIELLEGEWNCTVTEQVGDAVFESAANTARQANANSNATMPVIGIVIQKPTATTCIIARSGEVSAFAAPLIVGQEYYASTTPGQITTTVPTASGHVVQYIGYARNTSTLVVQMRAPTVRA